VSPLLRTWERCKRGAFELPQKAALKDGTTSAQVSTGVHALASAGEAAQHPYLTT
jgi:hypothetical protein